MTPALAPIDLLSSQDRFRVGLEPKPTLARVLLVEPNAALRSAILTVLAAEEYQAETCESLAQVVRHTDDRPDVIALVAWQSMEGMLAEERRHHLVELTQRLRLVLMVPRRWARLLDQTDLGLYLAGLIAKPFQADDLLLTLQRALAWKLGRELEARPRTGVLSLGPSF